MADWKTRQHLEDHWELHRREFPGFSIEQYDASAKETIAIGNEFKYDDPNTREHRVGYYDRESARFVAVDLDGFIRSHFRTDEDHVANLPRSTYQD
jgi:hypothetical protein